MMDEDLYGMYMIWCINNGKPVAAKTGLDSFLEWMSA